MGLKWRYIVLRLFLPVMPELAIKPLTRAFDEILAHGIVVFIGVASASGLYVRRQLASRPKVFLLALRAMDEFAIGPVAHTILKIVTECVLLVWVVLRPLVQVFATFAPVTNVSQKIPAY